VLKALENLDFLFNSLDGVLVSLKELFPEELKSNHLLGVLKVPDHVYLGGVALSERRQDFVLAIEDWVFLLVHYNQ